MSDDRYDYDMDDPLVYRNQMGRYKTDVQLAFINRVLPRSRMRILDVGGGGGRLAIPLADAGHDVTVMDVSSEALRLLKQRSGERVGAVHSDIESFECAEPFDATLVIDTLKYVPGRSVAETFTMINSVLCPGAVLVVAEINQASWRSRLSELLGRRRREDYNIASHDGYTRALAAAGFELQEMTGFLWMPFPFNSNSRLVPLFRALEDRLRLGRWVAQSPWLLIAARKIADPAPDELSP